MASLAPLPRDLTNLGGLAVNGTHDPDCLTCSKAFDGAWFLNQLKNYHCVVGPHHSTDDLWKLLFEIRGDQKIEHPVKNELMMKLLIDMLRHYSDGKLPDPSLGDNDIKLPVQPPKPKEGIMLLTSLGATIASDSLQPVATIGDIQGLPRATAIDKSDGFTGVITVNAQDPNANKNHTDLFHEFMGSKMIVHTKHCLVYMDEKGVLCKLPAGQSSAEQFKLLHKSSNDPARPMAAMSMMSMSNGTIDSSLLIDSLASGGPQLTSNGGMEAFLEPKYSYITSANAASVADSTGPLHVPDGYVLAGEIKLFGCLKAVHYVFKGDNDQSEMVFLDQANSTMSNMFGDSFSSADAELQNPQISLYMNKDNASQRKVGMWLDTALVLKDELFGSASGILKDVFATTSPPTLLIQAYIGDCQKLTDFFKPPPTLEVKASIQGLDTKIGRFLELTSAEIDIVGTHQTSAYSWTTSLRGTAFLTVPGQAGPMVMDYVIDHSDSSYTIALTMVSKDKDWPDAMGIPGFHLTQVQFTSSFQAKSKDDALSFAITATFSFGETRNLDIKGHYDSKGWSFEGHVPGTTNLQDLQLAWKGLYKSDLSTCNHAVGFTDLSLSVTSENKTLSLQGAVDIEGHKCISATLSLDPTGLHLTGDMEDVKFRNGTITVIKARMSLIIVKGGLIDPALKTPGISAAFNIMGIITVGSVEFDVVVSFAKLHGPRLLYVVYAKYTKTTVSPSLSAILKRQLSKVDIPLRDMVVMASNVENDDDRGAFPANMFDVPIPSGLSLYAKANCPPVINRVLHTQPLDVTLIVELERGQEEIEFVFATRQQMIVKRGLAAPKVSAGIVLGKPEPIFFLRGDLSVVLNRPTIQTLDFGMDVIFLPNEAQINANLSTGTQGWINPFGISENLIIHKVSLGVTFDYLAATYPSGLNFAGTISTGGDDIDLVFSLGENPDDFLAKAIITKLDLHDLTSFTNRLIGHDLIPLPPKDAIDFKDLAFYISSGCTIDTTFYPPGMAFKGTLSFFGEDLLINCAFDKVHKGFLLHAELGSFHLGPLQVKGRTGDRPTLDFELSEIKQEFLVDGKIALFGSSDIAITTRVNMKPTLAIALDADVKFTDLLMFNLHGELAGDVHGIKDLKSAKFDLTAKLQQNILNQIMALANSYMINAKKAVDEDTQGAIKKLDATQKAYEDHIAQCQRDVTNREAEWNKKLEAARAIATARKQEILNTEKTKHDEVNKLHANFDKKIAELQASLDRERLTAANKIQDAENNVARTRQEADRKINNAKAELARATTSMMNAFGDVDRAMKSAQGRVNDAQQNVDRLQNSINDCRWRQSHDSIWKRAAAAIELKGLIIAFAAATGALDVAKRFLAVTNFAAQQGPLKIAQAATAAAMSTLNVVKATADAELIVATKALDLTKETTQVSIKGAEVALEGAKKGCEELRLWKIADAALADYVKLKAGLLDLADKLVLDVANGVEKAMFEAAKAALAVAKSATLELVAAKDLLKVVEESADVVTKMGGWLVKSIGNILNITSVDITASIGKGSDESMSAEVDGKFCDHPFKLKFEFTAGKGEAFVKKMVEDFIKDAVKDLKKYIHL